ncbi:ADP-ribose pyrophosphatase, mitochondrial isoform X2 [Halyomorpha halys]|nr:ADP-ribose pyrophosphatase, mitochondrial isoform X2 [Halyomorpha halys]
MVNILNHYKCRVPVYPRTQDTIIRQEVPDDKVSWDVDWEQYDPPYFTSKHILNQPLSDPEIETGFEPKWNRVDGKIDRSSFMGEYKIHNGYPLNPVGRTGLRGRGVLYRWGPNHAGDPIVTRWKKVNSEIEKDKETHKPILQFIAIKRRDCNEWAIPGGMVDPGEVVSATLKREFLEEALNSLEMSPDNKKSVEENLNNFFNQGITVYQGYVDDIRNTDNAWIETTAQNFHDKNGDVFGNMNLKAGDDAIGVSWLDLSSKLSLYASHSKFLEFVAKRHEAHW